VCEEFIYILHSHCTSVCTRAWVCVCVESIYTLCSLHTAYLCVLRVCACVCMCVCVCVCARVYNFCPLQQISIEHMIRMATSSKTATI
jgi:hypothetical protein